MAALLDAGSVIVGQEWWLHRDDGNKDARSELFQTTEASFQLAFGRFVCCLQRYEESNHRHNFAQGIMVVAVENNRMVPTEENIGSRLEDGFWVKRTAAAPTCIDAHAKQEWEVRCPYNFDVDHALIRNPFDLR